MTKLCPRGKAAAKRKFRVYPSAYANAYASKICAGKIKDPSGVKRKDFRGSKAEGGLMEATAKLKRQGLRKGSEKIVSRPGPQEEKRRRMIKPGPLGRTGKKGGKNILIIDPDMFNKNVNPDGTIKPRISISDGPKFSKGGRARLRGGGICKKGMNRQAVGRNS